MPKVTVLPHPDYAPNGTSFEIQTTSTLCDALYAQRIAIEHACGKVAACTTCRIIVRQGFLSLSQTENTEEDMLDMAWGLESHSRLSCQARAGEQNIVIEVPRCSVEHAKENG